MIVVVGKVRTDPERRARLIELGNAVAAASREEPGCIDYRLCQSAEDENAFVFVEEWEDDAALQAHFATDHIATFMRDFPGVIVAPPEVSFHTVAGTRDLSDVSARDDRARPT